MKHFAMIKEDIAAVRANDPAAPSAFLIWLAYPGLHARWAHERDHWLWNHGHRFIARWHSQWVRFRTGVEIHPAAQIGRRLFIDHAMAVIIGETTIIGDDCVLYQGVTLGGTGKETGKRHPTLGNNVMVGVGAKVLGNITIGDNSKIGGGAVVVHDVPPNCTVVGVPGKIVIRNGCRVLDEQADAGSRQENLPDPTEEEIDVLRGQVADLRACVDALEERLADADKALDSAAEKGAAGAVSQPADTADRSVDKRLADDSQTAEKTTVEVG